VIRREDLIAFLVGVAILVVAALAGVRWGPR
jgi:hypothetical protein